MPQVYGYQHIIYLVLTIIATVGVCLLAKFVCKTDKSKNIILKVTAGVLLVCILANRISIAVFKSHSWLSLIPDSFCGLTSLTLSIAVLIGKKNNNVLHYVWLMGLLGGLLTVFYPDFVGQNQSFFFLPTISGLLHHSVMICLVILLFITNHLTVTYKKWYCTVFGFTAYITLGGFLITCLGYDNAFYMVKPILDGTPLTVWVMLPMYALGYSLILLVFELVRKYKNKKQKSVLSEQENIRPEQNQ